MLLGPDPGLHFHLLEKRRLARLSSLKNDGLTELPGEGLTSSGLGLVQRGLLTTLPFDPTYLWAPEGPG